MSPRRISSHVIRIIDRRQVDQLNIENIKDARILIIDHCVTTQDFYAVYETWVKDFLLKSSYCFIIITNIEFKSSIELNALNSVFGAADLSARQFVIQLNFVTGTNPSIFYKYENSVDLHIYDSMSQADNAFNLLIRDI